MEKIIFLDIDGPLIPNRAFFLPGNFLAGGSAKAFDPIAVAMINMLAEFTGAKVVLSTSWTRIKTKEWLLDHFKTQGLNIELHKDWVTPKKFTSERYHEINFWLDDWIDTNSDSLQLKFLIIDDIRMPKEFPRLASAAILVDAENGITIKNFERALKILGHSKKEFDNYFCEKRIQHLTKNPEEK